MSRTALRFFPFLFFAALGAVAAMWLVPNEYRAIEEHLLGFPTSDKFTLELRPIALGALCFLPALGAFVYAIGGTLDRYLARQMLVAVGICALALSLIWVLMDVQDNISEFQKAEDTVGFLIQYYGVTFPAIFVLLVPFALMLGLLYSLGKLSNSREIIAMIQTGRGVARVIAPLGTVGLFLSVACLLLNYHWAPWGDGYKKALLEYAKSGSASQANHVLYFHPESERTWFVGSFPYNYTQGEPLRDVIVRTKGDDGRPATVLTAPIARWDPATRAWIFEDAVFLDLRATLDDGVEMPEFKPIPSPHVVTAWSETPWQIVKPGLKQQHLGVPELRSWLNEHHGKTWVDQRPYLTQWHYRFSQPWICLVVVLLAAPLGIVFSRRGTAGGIAIAVFLSAAMLLAAELALSLGDAGYIPPAYAAWGTNLVFTLIALVLLYRRLRGRPIYQTLKKLFPLGGEG